MIPFHLHRRIPLVRRPFFQRDQALAERDAVMRERDRALAEHDALMRERDRALAEREALVADLKRSWVQHRPSDHLRGQPATAEGGPPSDDGDLISRIISAYQAACVTELGTGDSVWFTLLSEPKGDVHDALMAGDVCWLKRILRDPAQSALFYGFENLIRPDLRPRDTIERFFECQASYDALRCLAEALGVNRLENPEHYYHGAKSEPPSSDQLLKDIGDSLGLSIDFPNPFVGEFGLATSSGTATYRAVQAVYQAWRIAELTKEMVNPRILEIGGGLGRTAYYAGRIGRRNYTIVDLPMTAVAQGYFLGRTVGSDGICLYGEDRQGIRIQPPAAFVNASDRYDLVVNIDSFTEMSRATARVYCEAVKARSGVLLSINHEANAFTVREICIGVGLAPAGRAPYWMRRGYVEEVFRSTL